MTSEATSVVTPLRFASGIPNWKGWMAAIGQRQEEFQRHYDAYEPNEADIAELKALVEKHGVKALALGEDWCPDVWRGFAVLCKVAERTGMEVRLFKRDENKDIMAEFLNNGEFESIPTIVFYDRSHRYLGHWIERAKAADEGLSEMRKAIFPDQMPERDSAEWTALMASYREASIEKSGPWRHAQLTEMLQLVRSALA